MEILVGRRVCFGILLAVLAVVAAVGEGHLASAAPKQVQGYGSAEAFERECMRQGGTLAYGLGGEIACRLAKGTIVCDQRGNDCWYYPVEPDGSVVIIGTGEPSGKGPGDGFSSIELDGGLSGSSSSSSSGNVDVDPGDNISAS